MTASVLLKLDGPVPGPELVSEPPELFLLSSWLERQGEQPSSLVLRGPRGTGRSHLLEVFADQAHDLRLRVSRACGADAEAELPFSAVHQLLYPLRDFIADLSETQQEALNRAFGLDEGPPPSRFVISAAALALVEAAAEQTPLLLLIDEVGGIDQPSAEVLGFVARRLCGPRALFLVAVSDTDPDTITAGLAELRVGPLPRTRTGDPGASKTVHAPRRPWSPRPVAHPAPACFTGLTSQELRIAVLAAQGLTNKQIGERLFLSHRTVGTHLYKLFPKLGVTSRAALRDALEARRRSVAP